MQFSQCLRQFCILDLKTLVEYCADIDGFEAAGFTVGQSYDCNSDRFLSTMGGALFSTLQRIPVADIYPFFPAELFAYKLPDTRLRSISSFFDFLKSEDFRMLIRESQESITHNEFVRYIWSPDTFECVFDTLFADRERYNTYIDAVFSRVCDTILTMELQGETVLSIYTEIPQLRTGVINRLKRASPNVFGKQPSLHADAFSAFKNYMRQISFDPENNDSVVVEYYIGYCLQFFISSRFRTFISEYQTPKTIAYIGENNSYTYAADLIKAEIVNPNSTTDLVELFTAVEHIDNLFFARRKSNASKNMLPYASIVDFVIDTILKDELRDLNTMLKQHYLTRNLEARIVPTFRGDLLMQIDRVDQSFKDRIDQGKRIFRSVFNTLRNITPETMGSCCESIIKDNSRAAHLKKDSNFNLIPTTGINTSKGTCFSDKSYELIRTLADTMNKLFRLHHELESYGTSLAYFWHTYLQSSPNRGITIFQNHSTVASYLWYILSKCSSVKDNLTDQYSDSIQPLYLYITDSVKKNFYGALSRPYKQAVNIKDLAELSNAKMYLPTESKSAVLSDILSQKLLNINTYAFSVEFESCQDKPVIPSELCRLIYRDILQVPYAFRANGTRDKFEDELVDMSLIDHLTPYDFSEKHLDLKAYCCQMVNRIVPLLSEEIWSCICNCFRSISIAIFELAPRGGTEEGLNTKDPFATCINSTVLPVLSHTEASTILKWMDIASAYMKVQDYPFSSDTFKQYIQGLSPDTLDDLLNVEREGKDLPNVFMLRMLFGAFAILWQWVSNANKYNVGSSTLSVFSSAKLITDMALSQLQMLSDVGVTYNQYLQPFSEHLEVLRQINDSSSAKSYTIASTLEIQKIIMRFKQIQEPFFKQLRTCCDCALSHNSAFRGFEFLEISLQEASVQTNIAYNSTYGYDTEYNKLLVEQLCGALSWFMIEGNISRALEHLNSLVKSEPQINAFLLAAIAASDSRYIPRTLKNEDTFLSRLTAKLSKAFKTVDYQGCLLSNRNTDIQVMNEFRNLLASASIDESGFCMIGNNYLISRDVNNICYFLSRDGVWVGYISDLDPLQTKSFVELTAEVNHDEIV